MKETHCEPQCIGYDGHHCKICALTALVGGIILSILAVLGFRHAGAVTKAKVKK